MTEDQFNEIKAKIDKLQADVQNGTINRANILEEFQKIWKEIAECCPLKTNVEVAKEDANPYDEASFFN